MAKTASGATAAAPGDARFHSFSTDPRFRLPSRKRHQTAIDGRFSRMLHDEEFTGSARVDRYGRTLIDHSRKKMLQRLYRKGDPSTDQAAEVSDDEVGGIPLDLPKTAAVRHDPARHGGYPSSSSSDSESELDSDTDEEVPHGRGLWQIQDPAELEGGEVTRRFAIVNIDWDHIKSTDLMALFASFLRPPSGRVEKVAIYPSQFGNERMSQEELEGPPREIFRAHAANSTQAASKPRSSFRFDKRECQTQDGPTEAAAEDEEKPDDDPDIEDDQDEETIKNSLIQEGNDQDFDHVALRAYQLERLRYYYAIVTCTDEASARTLYDAIDGTEFQSSSNFIDMRFVPNDMQFDDQPRDECDRVPNGYRPIEFVTAALQSSRVKLTWDMTPEELTRKDSIRRVFRGNRRELEDSNLRAYLASDGEDEVDDDQAAEDPEGENEPRLTKKELARKRMREALGLGDDEPARPRAETDTVGDMQVTFAAALTDEKGQGRGQRLEENTTETYMRKEREHKDRKRQMSKAKRQGAVDPPADDSAPPASVAAPDEQDLGFDDPFFTSEGPALLSKSAQRKEERRLRREAKAAVETEKASQVEMLQRIVAEHVGEASAEHLEHFDMNDIRRAERLKSRESKTRHGAKAKAKAKARLAATGHPEGLQEGFEMDVNDQRFQAVFQDHEYAIDPSNPKYKATASMRKLLEEGRKKRDSAHLDGAVQSKKARVAAAKA